MSRVHYFRVITLITKKAEEKAEVAQFGVKIMANNGRIFRYIYDINTWKYVPVYDEFFPQALRISVTTPIQTHSNFDGMLDMRKFMFP